MVLTFCLLNLVPESGNETLVWLHDVGEKGDEGEVVVGRRGTVDSLQHQQHLGDLWRNILLVHTLHGHWERGREMRVCY